MYLLLTFTIIITNAQVNLVSNPSFENLLSCPYAYGQINKAENWNFLITGGGGTPDLYSSCCTQPNLCGIPNNISGTSFQYAKSGNNYVGLSCYASNLPELREYIQYSFSNNLISNHNYCIKIYVNLSNHSTARINTIGAYFDNGSVLTLSSHRIAYYDSMQTLITPQFYNRTSILDDTLNWMLLEGRFTATGNETYITLGNFLPDSLSNIFLYNPGPTGNYHSYYYIDDVSVIDISTPAFAGNDTSITAGDSIYLGRPSEIGLDEACVWFLNGIPIDTVAGIMVAPDSSTTYILQQTICGNVQYDSVTVTVDKGTGISALNKKDRFEVYPNPSNGEIWLKLEDFIDHAELKLYNINGMMVYQERIYNPGIHKIIYEFENGVYVISLKTKRGTIEEKVVIIR